MCELIGLIDRTLICDQLSSQNQHGYINRNVFSLIKIFVICDHKCTFRNIIVLGFDQLTTLLYANKVRSIITLITNIRNQNKHHPSHYNVANMILKTYTNNLSTASIGSSVSIRSVIPLNKSDVAYKSMMSLVRDKAGRWAYTCGIGNFYGWP